MLFSRVGILYKGEIKGSEPNNGERKVESGARYDDNAKRRKWVKEGGLAFVTDTQEYNNNNNNAMKCGGGW